MSLADHTGKSEMEMPVEDIERRIDEVLAATPRPDSVKAVRFDVGFDHAGDPAVRIYLEIDPYLAENLEKEEIQRNQLREYRQRIRSKIFELNSGYFPFIRLTAAA